jgi:hypothetical protein
MSVLGSKNNRFNIPIRDVLSTFFVSICPLIPIAQPETINREFTLAYRVCQYKNNIFFGNFKNLDPKLPIGLEICDHGVLE